MQPVARLQGEQLQQGPGPAPGERRRRHHAASHPHGEPAEEIDLEA